VVKNRLIDWGHVPFRTFDVWLKEQGFKELVKKVWTNDVYNGNGLERVKIKLKSLKRDLKLWRVEVFISDKFRRQRILDEIEAIDKCDDDDNLQEDIRLRRIQLLSALRDMFERKTAMIKQKSMADWIAKGDMNSKFFHSRLRWRMLNNDIKGILINGEWCEDPDQVKSEVRNHFEYRFEA